MAPVVPGAPPPAVRPTPPKATGVALAAALVVVLTWLGFLAWMAAHRDLPDAQWARLLTLLHSLEAVAFAAAGAIFGTQVQKQRVEAAERNAARAEDKAADAQKIAREKEQQAAGGRALAAAVRSERRAPGELKPRGAVTEATGDPLLALADEFFPETRS